MNDELTISSLNKRPTAAINSAQKWESSSQMFTKQNTLIFVAGISVIGLSIFVGIPYLVTNQSWGWSYGQETGFIGDTIGGISGPLVGFLGVILTFFAFYIQYQANQFQIKALNEQMEGAKQQEKQILLQQFESNFFELLKLHRENVSELDYRGSKGRSVIIKIVNEFFEIIDALTNCEVNIIEANQLNEQDVANIAYTILFFGTDETVSDVLENRFFEKYGKMEIQISWFIREVLRDRENPYRADKYYFNGHQSRLGHYFRHLRRIATYVHRNELLTPGQKDNYMRILRAQLSNHEQIVLFFNSISDLGLKWELKNDENETLITTYNLIRNIPLGSIFGYRPKKYYPNLKMENDFEFRV